jgi:peptide/nickel transport system permease protein
MRNYIMRRLLLFIPTLLGVSMVVFTLLRVIPGDPATAMLAGPTGEGVYTMEEVEELRERLGFNKPLHIQYVEWIGRVVTGNLGDSVFLNRSMASEIGRRFPITLQLAGLALIIVPLVGVPIGILAAIKQDSVIDYVVRGGAIIGLAMPSFFVSLLIILFLSTVVGWLPPLGFTGLMEDPGKAIQQLIFPALALSLTFQGLMLRITRTQMLEVMREDYIRTARAKGMRERVVIGRHAIRNAMIPIVTVFGLNIGSLFSGTVIIEIIFNLPGIGRGLIFSMFTRDLQMIELYIIYFALVALVANLLVDLTYGLLDPRIRFS